MPIRSSCNPSVDPQRPTAESKASQRKLPTRVRTPTADARRGTNGASLSSAYHLPICLSAPSEVARLLRIRFNYRGVVPSNSSGSCSAAIVCFPSHTHLPGARAVGGLHHQIRFPSHSTVQGLPQPTSGRGAWRAHPVGLPVAGRAYEVHGDRSFTCEIHGCRCQPSSDSAHDCGRDSCARRYLRYTTWNCDRFRHLEKSVVEDPFQLNPAVPHQRIATR